MRFRMGTLLVAAFVAAAMLPATFAAREYEINAFFDRAAGKFKVDADKIIMDQLVKNGIYTKEQASYPAYQKLARNLVAGITNNFDFTADIDGKTTPVYPVVYPAGRATGALSPPGSTVFGCGRISRVWIRMPFHDCGTYNRKTKKGGCNGSLRLEVPNEFAFPPSADGVAFFQSNTCPVEKGKSQCNFNNQVHKENAGFAASTVFFHTARFENANQAAGVYLYYPTGPLKGQPITWADSEMLGGIIALFYCGGYGVKMEFGRSDQQYADDSGLLPSPTEGHKSITKKFHRMGFSKEEMAILAGGSHSVACFVRGALDKTPSSFDAAWAVEATQQAKNPYYAPECNMEDPADFPNITDSVTLPLALAEYKARAKPYCIPKFVTDMAKAEKTSDAINKAATLGDAYFNQQFAKVFYKMSLLGFPGKSPDPTNDKFDGYTEDDQDTKEDRYNTMKGWGYKGPMI